MIQRRLPQWTHISLQICPTSRHNFFMHNYTLLQQHNNWVNKKVLSIQSKIMRNTKHKTDHHFTFNTQSNSTTSVHPSNWALEHSTGYVKVLQDVLKTFGNTTTSLASRYQTTAIPAAESSRTMARFYTNAPVFSWIQPIRYTNLWSL